MSDTVEDTPTTGQKFTAEVLGTFVLVFFGCGAAVYSGGDLVATALAFGLTVLVMAYAVGRISGGHFNPAVTLGAVLSGRLPWSQVGIYMAAQLLGALLAGAVLFGLGHGFEGFVAEGNMGQNFFGDQGSGFAWWAALLLELLMTAVFVWVILSVTDARNEVNVALGPLAIGLSLAMFHLLAIPLTGTSVNPARSIGVGVFAGTDAIVQLWLFVARTVPRRRDRRTHLPGPLRPRRRAGGRLGPQLRRRPEGPVRAGQLRGAVEPGPAGQLGTARGRVGRSPAAAVGPARPLPAAAAAARPGLRRTAAAARPVGPAGPAAAGPARSAAARQPGQWGAPQQPDQQPGQQPGQPGQPGHWGNPDGDDDGRTQVRRPD